MSRMHAWGFAWLHWKGQQVLCPACGAKLAVSKHFVPSVVSSRTNYQEAIRDRWIVIQRGPESEPLRGEQARIGVSKVLENTSLSNVDKASILDLPRIVAELPQETEIELLRLGRSRVASGIDKVVRSVLEATLRPERVHITPDIPMPRLKVMREEAAVTEDENIIGMVDSFHSPSRWISGILFGTRTLYFINPFEYSPNSGAVTYEDLRSQSEYHGIGRHDVTLGSQSRILCTKGLGVTRREILSAIRTIAAMTTGVLTMPAPNVNR